MPRLHVVDPNEATGEVKEIFSAFEQKLGKVINIFKGMLWFHHGSRQIILR